MSRARAAALVAVLALLVGALVVGSGGTGSRQEARAPGVPAQTPDLAALRSAAALAPCPAGLGAGLPDLVLPCVGAPGEVRLAAEGGDRPRLVNLWGTWCGPCVREVPLLQALHERTDEVEVVGVLTKDTPENALQFAEDDSLGFDMTYPSVDDAQGEVLRRFGAGPPVTLFVTADGRVAHVQRGEMTSRRQLDDLLARHLGVRPGARA